MKQQLMKYIPKKFKPYVIDIYEGKKEINPITNRLATTLIVKWKNEKISVFANKRWASAVIHCTYSLDDVREEE